MNPADAFRFFQNFFAGGGIILLFIGVFFLFVLGMMVFAFVLLFKRLNRNKKKPRLTVDAKVVAKRSLLSAHRSHASAMQQTNYHISTYYATFEVDGGDRMELIVPDEEFGLLVEGDTGKLTFQGDMMISFVRM